MKINLLSSFILLFLSLLLSSFTFASIYNFKLTSARGKTFDFSKYKDKNIIVTNIATHCGFSGQLEELEKISKRKNVVVVGIPSNDFGSQTPEKDEEVATFCRKNYGVTFFLSKKSIVSGDKKIPLISYLQKKTKTNEIKWNFEKFLIQPKEVKFIHYSSFSTEKIIKDLTM